MTRAFLLVMATVVLASACGAAAENRPAAPPPDPLDTVSGEELYRRGRLLADAGDFIRAEQYFAASMRRGFPEEQALPALMHVCVEASRLVAALQYAEPFLARHPEAWSLRMLVASIHMGMEHDEEAREQLEQVLRDAPNEPQAHYLLAVLYRDRLADARQAAVHFRSYLELAPDGPHVDEARGGLAPETDAEPESRPVRVPVRVPMPADGGEATPGEAEEL